MVSRMNFESICEKTNSFTKYITNAEGMLTYRTRRQNERDRDKLSGADALKYPMRPSNIPNIKSDEVWNTRP